MFSNNFLIVFPIFCVELAIAVRYFQANFLPPFWSVQVLIIMLSWTQAVEVGDVNNMELILKKSGDELNKPDASGLTPLQQAAKHGQTRALEYLLKQNTIGESVYVTLKHRKRKILMEKYWNFASFGTQSFATFLTLFYPDVKNAVWDLFRKHLCFHQDILLQGSKNLDGYG